MTITLKDIAQRVGKSVTTVSRALHDFDDVSQETKAEVRQIAEELGYIPNIHAQRLQKQSTDTIGFIMPTFGPRFADPFFSEFLAGIGNQAANLGFDLLVSTRPPTWVLTFWSPPAPPAQWNCKHMKRTSAVPGWTDLSSSVPGSRTSASSSCRR